MIVIDSSILRVYYHDRLPLASFYLCDDALCQFHLLRWKGLE